MKIFDRDFFSKLYNEAKEISQTAVAPLSQAYYSSILVYKNQDKYSVHAGSNIDPLNKENLRIAKFRNCAEKQAALSALEHDQLEAKDLKILLLFRLDNKVKKLDSKKLLPCIDCYKKYVEKLKTNNGVLVLISEEMEANDFLTDGLKPDAQVSFDDQFRLIFFKGDKLSKLKLEQGLGMNI